MDAPATDDVIVITAPRLPEAPGEAVYSRVPIDPDVLDNALRLDQALTIAPGASLFRRNDSGAANPTVQGLSLRATGPSGAGRALITLDGVPQQDPFGGWVIWGALPPELISGATIVRGAGAGPYGAGALTGNVALEERTAPGFVLSAETGEFGFSRVAGLGEVQSGGIDVLLAAGAEQSDDWVPVREGRGAADVPLWRDSSAAVARVQTHQGRVLISARVSGYGENRGSGLLGGDSEADGASASLTFVAAPEADRAGWRVQLWGRSSDMANSFVSVAPDRSTTTPASRQYETPASGWGANAALRWSNAEAGFDLRTASGETHELFRFVSGDFASQRIAGGETVSAGAYVEGWRNWGDWLVSGGARLDWWSAYDGIRRETARATGAVLLEETPGSVQDWAPTARLGARRAFGNTYLRAAAYAGFRPPTLNELYRPFRVGNDVTEANASLTPERLFGADAAIGADTAALSWSFGVFATRLDDPITNVTRGVGPGTFPPGVFVPAGGVYRVRENTGFIDAYGVEAEAHGALSDALSWRAAFGYTHARVDGGDGAPQLTDLQPAQAPEWSATAGLIWRAWDGGEVGANVRAESARYDDDLNTRRLDAATMLDLRVSQSAGGGAEIYAALDNALDADVETAVSNDGIVSLAAPRALRFGIRIAR